MIHIRISVPGAVSCLLPAVFVFLSVTLIAFSASISAATIEVTKYYVADANNGKYDRNPSLAMFNDQVWMFYSKGDDGSTGGVRGPGYNPDNDSYVIWYKVGLSENQPFGGPETRLDLSEINRPVGFDQRDVSAVSFDGSLYVFTSAGFGGSDHPVYYYRYDGAWSGPVALLTGGGGHVNAVCDADRVYFTLEQGVDATLKSVVFTWNGTSLNGPFTIINGNGVAKIAKKGNTLYVVSVAPGASTVNLHTCPASASPTTWTHVSNPITVDGAMIWDPSLCVEADILHALAAPSTAVPDRQWIVQSFSTDNGVNWSPVRTITTGGSGKSNWWEYWPVAYSGGKGYLLLFTTEGYDGVYGDGKVGGIGTDWSLTNNHTSYIQPAIDMAADGDSVLIGGGIFTGDGNRDISFLGKSIVVMPKSPGDTVIIDCDADSLDPHRGFVFENGEGSASVLKGMSIRNAYPPLDTMFEFVGRFGGGVYCPDGSSPTIADCRFEKCFADAGAGLVAWNAPNLSVTGCTFHSNQSTGAVAATFAYSRVFFSDCEFDSNVTLNATGGAVEYHFCTGSQTDCVYRHNSARDGGALVVADSSIIGFTHCTFTGNIATGTYGDGGAVKIKYGSECGFTSCVFEQNFAMWEGGAIDCSDGSSMNALRSTFTNNVSRVAGGAVSVTDSSSIVLNECGFALNSSDQGSALEVGSGGSLGYAASIENCTFAWNKWGGGAVYIAPDAESVTLRYSLVAFNENCSAIACGMVPTLECCDLFGNEHGDWTGVIAGQLGQNGNISKNPRFCSDHSGDLHINATSPCARGNNSCEWLIGADEVGCYWICGDANGDTTVNISDAVYLISYIFIGGPAPDPLLAGDANCDGTVNISDAVYLISYIFSGGPAPCAGCK